MAKRDDDEFLSGEFDAAVNYIREHPEFALCRVRHDISFHRPPVDMAWHDDGGWSLIYACDGCGSEVHRRHYADGRYHSSSWKYAEGYQAPKGSGFALITRSGKAAFNLALRDTMSSQPKPRRTRRKV